MFYELYLPFPPTINSYYVKTRNGQFISAQGKKFRAEVDKEIAEQFPEAEPLVGRIFIEVILHMPDKRIRDLDNYMKPLLDALTLSGVWEDDGLIDQMTVYRGTVANKFTASCRLRVYPEAGPLIPHNYWPD